MIKIIKKILIIFLGLMLFTISNGVVWVISYATNINIIIRLLIVISWVSIFMALAPPVIGFIFKVYNDV
jgi:hypothetical protein